ncbi:MAG: endonuclease domain-containing protein [Calditrichaeota bacterium]|nr:MAG: endonuclease domain-containing protein [Calditrichota bacterium]
MTNKLNNKKYLKEARRELRNNSTQAEKRLWIYLKNSQLEGRKFRRQHSFGSFILDFYCPSEKLAIELDGKIHFNEENFTYDQQRTKILNSYGIKVLRFENKMIFENLQGVLEKIKMNFKVLSSTELEK